MADVSSQHQPGADADIDASIDSLLTGVETADAAMDPAAHRESSEGGAGSVADAVTAAALDDALVMNLMQGASAEIESAAPGPMDLPPVLEGADVAPNAAEAGEASPVAEAMHASAGIESAIEPNDRAELERVNQDLERPAPEAVRSVSPAPLGIDTPSVDVVAADLERTTSVDSGASMDPAAALASEMREVEASLNAAHDAAKAAIPEVGASSRQAGAPGGSTGSAGSAGSAGSGPPDSDLQFLSPEDVERDVERVAHEKSTSVRELDEHLANAAPRAVEAAISAAAAKVEERAASHGAAVAPVEAARAGSGPTSAGATQASVHATPTSPVAGSTATTAAPTTPPLATEASLESPKRGVREALAPVAGVAAAALGVALSPLARLHSKLGEPMRQTIGYVAAMTMLFAIAAWAFFLLRGQPKLDAVSPQKHLLMPGEVAHAEQGSGDHGESAHGEAGHGGAAPSNASSESHGSSKSSAGHGEATKKESGGHGASAKKDAGHGASAKKPPAKKDAKKDTKKSGGEHASGH